MSGVRPHADDPIRATSFDRELNRVIDDIRRGELGDASKSARDVARRAHETGEALALGRAMTFISEISLLEGSLKASREAGVEAIRILKRLPLWGGVSRASRQLAEVARVEGNASEAWGYLHDAEEAALAIPTSGRDAEVRARALFECSIIAAGMHCDENHVDDGIEQLRTADLLAVELTDPLLLGDLALVRGRLEWLLDANQGLELMRKAERIFAANRLPLRLAASLEAQGDCLLSIGDLEGARDLFVKALAQSAGTAASARTARLNATVTGIEDRLRAARSLDIGSGKRHTDSSSERQEASRFDSIPVSLLLPLVDERASVGSFCESLVRSLVRDCRLTRCAAIVRHAGGGVRSVVSSEPEGLSVEGVDALVDRDGGGGEFALTSDGSLSLAVAKVDGGEVQDVVELFRRVAAIRLSDRALAELRRDYSPQWSDSLEHGMVVASLEMQSVLAKVVKAAQSDCTVLITGESGVGKERVAKAVHQLSRRASSEYVVTNCAAIPSDLVEAKLFGHKKGSFTGASVDNLGVFRSASGGTLFLDEIGELPLAIQPKILRALDVSEVEPIGATQPVKVDVRVIAATNRDLEREVAAGRFRVDLFHRLNVVTITVPPLRARKADILPLARHFVDEICKKNGIDRRVEITAATERVLREWRWPGNVGERFNLLMRTLLLNDYRTIEVDQIAPWTRERKTTSGAIVGNRAGRGFDDVMNGVARETLLQALREAKGNRIEACRLLKINRSRFYRVAHQVGLDLSDFES